MKLDGIIGSHLFGFMAALGTLALLDERAKSRQQPTPRLHFSADGTATISEVTLTADAFVGAVFDELQAFRPYYENELSAVGKPTDFTPSTFTRLAENANRKESNILAGLACCVGEEAFESTLCAANGAGQGTHQAIAPARQDDCRTDRRRGASADPRSAQLRGRLRGRTVAPRFPPWLPAGSDPRRRVGDADGVGRPG